MIPFIGFAIIGLLVLLVAGMVIGQYNRLVRLRVASNTAWSQIDVQLKRRHDLIPNLVETVKGYMKHEKETLNQVMEARSKAMGAPNPAAQMKAEGELSGFLGRLMAVWENYPDLKANQNAMQLQGELSNTENIISSSREEYNTVVRRYNTAVQVFPASLVAGMFGFQRRDFFEVPEEQREAPQVKF